MQFYQVLIACFVITLNVATAQEAKKKDDSECTQQELYKLLDCADAASEEIGFQLTANATEYRSKFRQAIMDGKLNLDRICLVSRQFQECLGDTKMCMKGEVLMEIGVPQDDAYQLIGEYASITYECRPEVYKILKKDEACLGEVYFQQGTAMEQCGITLKNQIAGDPKNMCMYDQEFLDCFTKLYSSCQTPIAYTMCNVAKRSLVTSMPQCAGGMSCSEYANDGSSCSASSNDCDSTKFNECSELYAVDIGFPVTKDYLKFTENMERSLMSGNLTLERLCMSFFHYKDCLGSSVGCFSKNHLLKMEFPVKSMYGYVGEMASMTYKCSQQGYSDLKSDFGCVLTQNKNKFQ